MGRAQATRETILERAVDLASVDGLQGLTIGRLSSELEMSKSGLFAHFGSKEELQLATVKAAAAKFVSEVIAPAQEAPEGIERLRAYCELYLTFLQRGGFPGGCFWAAAATEFDDRPGAVREAIASGVAAWIGELRRQAQIGGAGDPEQLAYEIYSLGLGANTRFRLLGAEDAFSRAKAGIERRICAIEDGRAPDRSGSSPTPGGRASSLQKMGPKE